jgi:prophage maintenance system killer protein
MELDQLNDEELVAEIVDTFFEVVLVAHKTALDNGGGIQGVKDENLIRSAIGRPFQEFDGVVFIPL